MQEEIEAHPWLGCQCTGKKVHSVASESFLEWRASVNPRWGALAARMRSSRASFKLCLWWCRANEDKQRAQVLAAQLAGRDTTGLWYDPRTLFPNSHTLPMCGSGRREDTATIWGDHFEGTLNCVADMDKERILWSELSEMMLEAIKALASRCSPEQNEALQQSLQP